MAGVLVMAFGGIVLWPDRAQAAEITILVNSADFGGPDTDPGDGLCDTGTTVTLEGDTVPRCTLRAALEEANALADTNQVTVTLDPRWPGGAIVPNATVANRMVPAGATSSLDTGAYYHVTGPMTIDLNNALSLIPPTWAVTTGLLVSGSDVTLKNFTDWYTQGSSITAGATAENLTIDGGSSVNTASYYPRRFLTIRGGAKNVTLTNYTVGGFFPVGTAYGLITFDNTAGTTTTNTVIDNVNFPNPIGGTCNSSSGTGCSATVIASAHTGLLDGVKLINSSVSNLNRGTTTVSRIITFASGLGPINDLVVSGNTFTDNVILINNADGLIELPYLQQLGGANRIDNNTFTTTIANQGMVIYWWGPYSTAGNTTASNLWITDNYFDGYGSTFATAGVGATIRLHRSGIVTVARNTFGPATKSPSTTTTEETAGGNGSSTTVMFNNWDTAANQKINPWYPTSATVQGCAAHVEVVPPSAASPGSVLPQTPVTLDAYWTVERTAEVFLGSYANVTDATELNVPLPAEAIATDGTVSGYLRFQTQGGGRAQPQSSQYSRTIALAGTCQPAALIEQAEAYGDTEFQAGETMTRQVQFRLSFDVQLESGPTAAMFSLAGSTAPGAQVVSVAKQQGGPLSPNDDYYLVTCQANDSGTIELSLPAGVVAMAGTAITNQASTTGATPDTDNIITFANPLEPADPAQVMTDLTMAGSSAGAYVSILRLKDGAPLPGASVTIDIGLPTELEGLVLDPGPAYTITAGESESAAVTISAPVVPANPTDELALTVSSADPQYDGLLLAAQPVTVTTVDSVISVVKRAWIDVPKGATYEDILDGSAGAVEVADGSRLAIGTPLWWTYTVTYTELGTASSRLTTQNLGVGDLVVADSDPKVEVICPSPAPVLLPGQSMGCLGQAVAQ